MATESLCCVLNLMPSTLHQLSRVVTVNSLPRAVLSPSVSQIGKLASLAMSLKIAKLEPRPLNRCVPSLIKRRQERVFAKATAPKLWSLSAKAVGWGWRW